MDKKYEYIKLMGGGAYGVVCAALNKENNQKVAIKKIPNAFEDLIDAKRILREIKLLSSLPLSENSSTTRTSSSCWI